MIEKYDPLAAAHAHEAANDAVLLKVIIERLQDENKALHTALQDLYDVQNGPPLELHKEYWEVAYEAAGKVLASVLGKQTTPHQPVPDKE